MTGLDHIRTRLAQYGAAWVTAFLIAGTAILIGTLVADLMVATDWVLAVMIVAVALAMGIGVVASLLSRQALGIKLVVLLGGLLLALPLMWAPVAAAVAIAFFADRSIEYSGVYAAFQIGVSDLLFPLEALVRSGAIFASVWALFQGVATVVGFVSALANIWPLLRRFLGPEPAPVG